MTTQLSEQLAKIERAIPLKSNEHSAKVYCSYASFSTNALVTDDKVVCFKIPPNVRLLGGTLTTDGDDVSVEIEVAPLGEVGDFIDDGTATSTVPLVFNHGTDFLLDVGNNNYYLTLVMLDDNPIANCKLQLYYAK